MDTRHLKKRRQTWYARHNISTSPQGVVGWSEFVRSLKILDPREGHQRKHVALAQTQRRFIRYSS